MKGMKIVFALVVISVMAMSLGSANAAVIFQPDFESYSVGTPLGQDGWLGFGSPYARVDESTFENQFMPGYKWLAVGTVGNGVGRDTSSLYRPFDAQTGMVRMEVIYSPHQSETSWRSISLRDSSGTGPEYYDDATDIAAMVGSSKNYSTDRWWFFANDADGRQWYEGAHDVYKQNVYKIVIDANVATQTYDATVNFYDKSAGELGPEVASWAGLSFNNTVSDISRVFVQSWDSGSQWDHLLIESSGGGAIPGDFDADNDVDGVDFGLWQAGYPTASGASLINGDADADGDVDGVDFGIWQANYPTNLGGAAIPEPATICLLALAGTMLLARRRR